MGSPQEYVSRASVAMPGLHARQQHVQIAEQALIGALLHYWIALGNVDVPKVRDLANHTSVRAGSIAHIG